jgi:hypothetical protein
MMTYSLLMAWGQNDEGDYSTCVKAESQEEAITLARHEMHAVMWDGDDEYDDDLDGDVPEYEVIDIYEGANIWAADEMLAALKQAHLLLYKYLPMDSQENADGLEAVESAIRNGNGDDG